MKNKIIPGLIIICWLACSQNKLHEISNVLSELRNGDLIERTFFFYPSILRIINLKDNPDYYDFIRNVNKLVVFRMDEEFTKDNIENLRFRLSREEHFEEYARVNLKGQQIYLLGKEDLDQWILIIHAEGKYYIADIVGQVDFWSLNKLMRSMAVDSSGAGQDFLDVFSLLGIQRGQDDIDVDSVSVDSLRPEVNPELINTE